LRHEAAQIVGYTNYAEYSLASKMASSVEEVQKFLEDLADRSRSTAADELRKLEEFAGQSLEAWDIAYFSEKLRMDQYAVSDEQLRPYFPVESVLAGLFSVIERLYGLTIEPVADVDTWHSDVRFYELRDAEGNAIGGFYVDLFARPNKRSGAWMDECISRKKINGKIQNPVAHLVCNFAGPTESSPSLLTHDDVVTLFHECGHTLHHLLTRMEIPSISGINGVPWDAVELPSQFMENFAWEPEVIKLISGHYRTRDPLPAEVLERLQASRIFQAGLQMLRQLEFSLFDLRLHAEYDDNTEIMALLGAVRERVAVVRIPEFNRFPHAFSHIFGGGYAAGYYSYKWAEVLAADAWSAFAEHGIFDQETATRFRQTILEIGGTGKIADAFVAFRGREPDIQPLLAQSGITMSAEQ
jgi:oligopeptidase A